eukprot:3034683-Prymnesium_polylepis.1
MQVLRSEGGRRRLGELASSVFFGVLFDVLERRYYSGPITPALVRITGERLRAHALQGQG